MIKSRKDCRVLIACEFSGIVRDAFIRKGFDAVSCDFLPSESNLGPHVEGDVSNLLKAPWDLVIAHPPCTYLAHSGVRWLHERPERWENLEIACEFFKACLNANSPRVAVENPVPHRYAVERIGVKYDQLIHPYQYGHGERKRTCLWLKGLPSLVPTDIVDGRIERVANTPDRLSRAQDRSRFFPGIAEAMADQWGVLLYG